jgi:hypothetical protein
MEWDEAFGEASDEVKNSSFVKESKDIASALKQAHDFQKMLGNSLRIPGEGAGEDAVKEFREKAARAGLVPKDQFTDFVKPEKAELYALSEPPADAVAIGLTQDMIDKWKADAHQLGLSPKQFDSWATALVKNQRETLAVASSRNEAANAALLKEWGPEAFESRKALALQAAKKFGGDELVAVLGSNPNPAVLKALAAVGKTFVETGNDFVPRPHYAETRAEAALKLTEIKTNKAHPFNRPRMEVGASAHDAALAEVVRLTAISMGQKPGKDFMFDEVG